MMSAMSKRTLSFTLFVVTIPALVVLTLSPYVSAFSTHQVTALSGAITSNSKVFSAVSSSSNTASLSTRHNGNISHKMAASRRSLAVKRTSTAVAASQQPPGRAPSTTSLSSAVIDADENNGGNSIDGPKSLTNSDVESLLPLEIAANIQKPSWLSVLDSPSLQMGRFLTLGAAAIYGTNFATVKLLDDAMPLSVSAALRFGLASSVVSAIVLGRENDDVDPMAEKERNLAFWSGAEIGLWYSIGYLAQAEGLETVAAGKSAFFNALAVIVVPILDALVKGKVLQRKEIAAVGLACLGVGLLEVGPSGLTITSGDLLAFTQTIFFGIGYWRLEAVSHAHPHQAARITVGQLAAVASGATVYALTEFGLGHLQLNFEELVEWFGDPFITGALVWTGLFSTALALYLETVALKVVSATELTLLMTTTSLWGASFAYVTIGELLSPTGFLGGLLILGGCVMGNLASPVSKEKLETLPALSSQQWDEKIIS